MKYFVRHPKIQSTSGIQIRASDHELQRKVIDAERTKRSGRFMVILGTLVLVFLTAMLLARLT
jgi:hypothetical protein